VNHGVVAGAEGNQESFLRNTRQAVMDMDALAATRTAAHPAGAVVTGDHPQAQTAKASSVSVFPRVTGETEAFFELSGTPTDAASQEDLAGHI
jgi:hypothetical protein